ncbi:hypothetical protein COCMIDRAFT_95294 [Bipolaris oryzae ATCC 44560]|uniref:Uncharacterized protein n=1 Tax=Bipolaris oryzae ATCC 44560 TaxID=930090 RepID=W6Z1C6_COCMI|nr:uncharacterized protein COCMIDRAFT_95294 [Bipolaris oryzae ATCC 44560]EUC45562.1 hypothetical protein COCMIDRAFT_95294 [Bipolaris oryzae ATCC 44560]
MAESLPPQPTHHASWEHAWLRHVQQIGMATFVFNWRHFFLLSYRDPRTCLNYPSPALSARLANLLP